jgi:hypothetical protein
MPDEEHRQRREHYRQQRATGVRSWAKFRRQEHRRNLAVGVLVAIIFGLLIVIVLML